MSLLQSNRRRLLALPDCQFVEPADFIDCAISRRSLSRVDDPVAGVHGLLDQQTGARIYVEDEKLDHWRTMPR